MIEITGYTKRGGPLTKRISLKEDGTLCSDGSQCVMPSGGAERIRLNDLHAFGRLLDTMTPADAIGLGTLRRDLPDTVEITTKVRLDALNGAAVPHLIARTGEFIVYRHGQPAVVLIDVDTKGMPAAVKARVDAKGGFWSVIVSVLPELETAGRVTRPSTSSGLSRCDTGERLAGSNGEHIFPLVTDGADAERFLRTLHDRCWLAGFGWLMVGAGGQLLERSIVDRMVAAPERLVFEGAPVLDPPLVQDTASRRPIVTDGVALDTRSVCPELRLVEQEKLRELKAKEANRRAPDRAKAHKKFVIEQAERLVTKTGCTPEAARRTVERQCGGVLLPAVVLPFDAEDVRGCTVADVLADPDRFVGATLADPLEGIEYGLCKAKVMQRPDGTLWINSFAHGRTTYELKYDADAIAAFVAKAADADAIAVLARQVAAGDIEDDDLDRLIDALVKRVKVGKMIIKRAVTNARKGQARQRHQADQDRRAAERTDPRPRLEAPLADAPWLPAMEVLNDVHGASKADEPPMRDLEGVYTVVHVRRAPSMHALTTAGANQEEATDSRLPAPEHPLLTRLTEAELAEVIERHIDHFDPKDQRSVHLAGPFVKHFMKRTDDALPMVSAITTLPMVLADGTPLHGRGLNRERGIVFRIPHELMRYIPAIDDCHDYAVADAFAFLTDTWLVDVATDFTGKCIIIGAALTLIQRSLLPNRPTFTVTAGRRGGGKTTLLFMLLMAITGMRPAAAAWSPDAEERRKALLSYLMSGVPAIVWDNIPRGTQITCPHIEMSCTTELYVDRRLGVNELITTAAATIHFFTGNNIGPRDDLASRNLTIRLEVDRADPENRPFTHPDPVAWTEANRGKILNALFTVLLGNPRLLDKAPPPARTRFKDWYHLVGSAVEHAVTLSGGSVDFQGVFLTQEEDDEGSSSLADALTALANKWANAATFTAGNVAALINDYGVYGTDSAVQDRQTLRDVLYPDALPNLIVTPKSVGKRLGSHIGEPVMRGGKTYILKSQRPDIAGPNGTLLYFVQVSGGEMF
jgi:hypothetical protein